MGDVNREEGTSDPSVDKFQRAWRKYNGGSREREVRTETGMEEGKHFAQAGRSAGKQSKAELEAARTTMSTECVRPENAGNSNVTVGVIDRRTDQPPGGGGWFIKGSSQNAKEVDCSKVEKEK